MNSARDPPPRKKRNGTPAMDAATATIFVIAIVIVAAIAWKTFRK